MTAPENGAKPAPDVRRGAILASVRRRHGAATDFDAAGDPGMAEMLRSHAGILQDLAATAPPVRRKQAATPAPVQREAGK